MAMPTGIGIATNALWMEPVTKPMIAAMVSSAGEKLSRM